MEAQNATPQGGTDAWSCAKNTDKPRLGMACGLSLEGLFYLVVLKNEKFFIVLVKKNGVLGHFNSPKTMPKTAGSATSVWFSKKWLVGMGKPIGNP